MTYRKQFIEDQFRGFEADRDGGNNVVGIRVKKDNEIIASWKIRDARTLDAAIADAIGTAIEHGIVPVGTV
jgi:hypothetical protein